MQCSTVRDVGQHGTRSMSVSSNRQLVGGARARRGFTLIEAALVTVIVGVGVLAIVAAQQAYHQQNDHAQRTGAALMLANEIRELMVNLPAKDPIYGNLNFGPETGEATHFNYNDIDDFAGSDGGGTTISPPIHAMALHVPPDEAVIEGMEQWTQEVSVAYVLPNSIDVSSGTLAYSPMGEWYALRITCRVLYQGPNDDNAREITRMTWVRPGR
ncbi:MAG: hypothetical protein WD294_07175 [Phycisphaeraceae bacterium]